MRTTIAAYTEDLIPGARNAVRTCLRVAPEERVTVITDLETEDIAASLADQVREVGAPVEFHVLEDYGPRPMLNMDFCICGSPFAARNAHQANARQLKEPSMNDS